MKRYIVPLQRTGGRAAISPGWLPVGPAGTRPATKASSPRRAPVPLSLAGSLAVHALMALLVALLSVRVLLPNPPEAGTIAMVFAPPEQTPAAAPSLQVPEPAAAPQPAAIEPPP